MINPHVSNLTVIVTKDETVQTVDYNSEAVALVAESSLTTVQCTPAATRFLFAFLLVW